MKPLSDLRWLANLGDGIWWAAFNTQYAMCMTCLRVSEYKESDCDNFAGKMFSLLEYMHWYSKVHGEGSFSYPGDWHGYNIGSREIDHLYVGARDEIPDFNEYDAAMVALADMARASSDDDFYIVATLHNDRQTLRHEVAHAMFSKSKDYSRDQALALDTLPREVVVKLKSNLTAMGYGDHQDVHFDEMQAYLSTGTTTEFMAGLKQSDVRKCRTQMMRNFDRVWSRVSSNIPK